MYVYYFCFFFKQKTAYEMRISDWSSDVCSSDLAYGARFLWMWPNARISVMGGEQAASVLATVKRDGIEARGETWSDTDEDAFRAPIRAQYERQGNRSEEHTSELQ